MLILALYVPQMMSTKDFNLGFVETDIFVQVRMELTFSNDPIRHEHFYFGQSSGRIYF